MWNQRKRHKCRLSNWYSSRFKRSGLQKDQRAYHCSYREGQQLEKLSSLRYIYPISCSTERDYLSTRFREGSSLFSTGKSISLYWTRSLAYALICDMKKWSVSRASFIKFCEASIQCIHTTVEYLNEPDQRRPTDAPYTNGYFLDLTEQMRQYAAMITASRERLAAGRAPTEDDYTT